MTVSWQRNDRHYTQSQMSPQEYESPTAVTSTQCAAALRVTVVNDSTIDGMHYIEIQCTYCIHVLMSGYDILLSFVSYV